MQKNHHLIIMFCFLVTKSHPSSPLSGHLLIIIFCSFLISKVYPVYNLQIQFHHHHWIQLVFLSHNLAIIVVILIFLSACKQLFSSSLCYCLCLFPKERGRRQRLFFTICSVMAALTILSSVLIIILQSEMLL